MGLNQKKFGNAHGFEYDVGDNFTKSFSLLRDARPITIFGFF